MAELHDYGGGNDFGGPNPESTEAARLLGASGLLTRIHRSVGFSPRSFDDVDSEHWYLHKSGLSFWSG